ncbi:MAG: DUF1499 domain-containing protein [Gemmatimonadota bacterium]|nr:DUF1499 domain-containing protein [Gemmatimonadota bacterium]
MSEAKGGRSWAATLAIALAVASVLLLLAAGPGVRSGIWHYRTGFTVMRIAAWAGIAAAVLGLIAAALGRGRPRALVLGIAAVILGLTAAAVPWSWQRAARGVPPIHDISTDLENPPEFRAILPLRADAPNPAEYGGPEIAQQQREAYPSLGPLELERPPAEAFGIALDAARGMGWEIVAADTGAGIIEATDETKWFGFKDDVIVRVTPAAGGSQIDVRSVSRVGRGDVGTNARRIRTYLERLGDAAGEAG